MATRGKAKRVYAEKVNSHTCSFKEHSSEPYLPDELNDCACIEAEIKKPSTNDQTLCLSTEDIMITLRRVNEQKAVGPDNIPGWVLLEYADQLVDVFTNIFSMLLSNHHTYKIIPVPK